MSKYSIADYRLHGLYTPVDGGPDDFIAMCADLAELREDLSADRIPGTDSSGTRVEYRTATLDEGALVRQALAQGHEKLVADYCAAKQELRDLKQARHLCDNNYTGLGGLAAYHLCTKSLQHLDFLKRHMLGDLDHDGYFDRFMHGFLQRNLAHPGIVTDIMAYLIMCGTSQKTLRAAKSFYPLYRKSCALTYESWESACLAYADDWSRIHESDIELAEILIAQIYSSFEARPKAKKAYLAKCAELLPKLGVLYDDEIAEIVESEASDTLSFLESESGYSGKPTDAWWDLG